MAERVIAVVAIVGCAVWAGYYTRDVQARAEAQTCAAYLEDGRHLIESYISTTTGRVHCLYAEPVVTMPKGKKKKWM
jgi:hypothetical protein